MPQNEGDDLCALSTTLVALWARSDNGAYPDWWKDMNRLVGRIETCLSSARGKPSDVSTTTAAGGKEGRNAVLIEMNDSYADIAENRIFTLDTSVVRSVETNK